MDKNTQSILFLTDESSEPARIGFVITAGGVHYYLTRLQLAPHETRAIDLGQLENYQRPDFKGHKIPSGATDGSVNWIRIDNVPVSGRVAVIERQTGTASSYDCFDCSCGLVFTGTMALSPANFSVVPQGLIQISASCQYHDCNGLYYWVDQTDYCSWSSSSTSVATVDSWGEVTGIAAGTVSISASWFDCEDYPPWYQGGGCSCSSWGSGSGNVAGLTYTQVQHNYPDNPFGSKGCWISQFFDHISPATGHPHHAEDVVDSNGSGGGVDPSIGDPVYAAEGGSVVSAPSTFGPASPPYPNCGSHDANYVKIKGSDNYYTVYIHVHPLVSVGQSVSAGQEIGTVDNSGCESGPHVHIQREDGNLNKYNFTLPCTNPTPTKNFWDGLVDDIDNDY